jgi:hypothetical protein
VTIDSGRGPLIERRISEPDELSPTAQQLVELLQESPERFPVGLGSVSVVHVVPSHDSICWPPTATQSVELVQVIALTAPGLGTVAQVDPFHS